MGKAAIGCLVVLLVVGVLLAVAGGGVYNQLVGLSQGVDAQWAQVQNVYQRRADLIPNLVATVQGAANFEKSTLEAVTEARASVGRVTIDPKNLPNDPAAFAKYEQAQAGLSGALSRLLVVSENYPQLKSDQNFRDLQAQLEGTENRITVARNRYIRSVQDYNTTVRTFPNNLTAMLFGFKPKPNFTVANEQQISNAPTVSFDTTAPPAAPAGQPATQ